MTVRLCFESCLVELNKVLAPSLLLGDFNYLINKAILKYFNKRYALFEVNLQLTDDLRVLTKTLRLDIKPVPGRANEMGKSYRFELPFDYVHILNCICEYIDYGDPKCDSHETMTKVLRGATKLDSDKWPSVITNYYMRPSFDQPYYYISNIDEPTPIDPSSITNNRGGNSSIPILEIKCGDLPSSKGLDCIYIDYLRAPEHIELTLADLDPIDDNTPVLEFPDYVIYEIINELVLMCLENGKDPRLLTFPAISLSIALK